MKLYHYALFFALVCVGFFMTADISLRLKMQEESKRKTEYDCLVAAVDAAVDVVFARGERNVTKADLVQAADVFFQTLEVLWYGTTDRTSQENLKMRVPCLVVFSGDGYYRYCFEKGKGYGWSEMVPYEQGKVPSRFFEETEELLTGYHDTSYTSSRKYRIGQAGKGVWEQEISPPCVFAIYAPVHSGISDGGNGFVYAASDYQQTAYYVTEDNRCHLPFCEEYKEGKVIACYSTQKESAEAGATPCEECMR
ncbi:MAG: hypothetical protein IJX95_09370 [Lachnospiraceae bacterium]|nr:hypothetical protein [Lachnospiraceae bacterium]